MNTWRAGCGGSRTSGSEGGPEKPTHREMGRALRSDPYTYIPTGEGWLYLASVIDIGSRRLLGYSMADHMRTELVINALDMAVTARGGNAAGVIAHADRGSQYTSEPSSDFGRPGASVVDLGSGDRDGADQDPRHSKRDRGGPRFPFLVEGGGYTPPMGLAATNSGLKAK